MAVGAGKGDHLEQAKVAVGAVDGGVVNFNRG
jgi:hypothetical protein